MTSARMMSTCRPKPHDLCRKLIPEMSTHPVVPPVPPSEHPELPVEEQLARARPWAPTDEPVFDDLSDEEEAAFLEAIAR